MRRVLNRGEAVNALKRAIYNGRISPAQAKRVDEMQAVADALSLMANIVMAWTFGVCLSDWRTTFSLCATEPDWFVFD